MWCFLFLEETYENIGTPSSPRGVPHGPVGGGDSDKAEDEARGFGDELLGEVTKNEERRETKRGYEKRGEDERRRRETKRTKDESGDETPNEEWR